MAESSWLFEIFLKGELPSTTPRASLITVQRMLGRLLEMNVHISLLRISGTFFVVVLRQIAHKRKFKLLLLHLLFC